jgi:ribosomal protein S18 acetylase RimI-like enzyme
LLVGSDFLTTSLAVAVLFGRRGRVMPETLGLDTVQVRRLGIEDFKLAFEAIRVVKQPTAQSTFSGEYLRKFLAQSQNILIVAEGEGMPRGFLLAYLLDRVDRDQRMVCLYEIGVSECFRRQGIGRAMIEALKLICKNENAMKTWVITNRSNLAAFRLYQSTGALPISAAMK